MDDPTSNMRRRPRRALWPLVALTLCIPGVLFLGLVLPDIGKHFPWLRPAMLVRVGDHMLVALPSLWIALLLDTGRRWRMLEALLATLVLTLVAGLSVRLVADLYAPESRWLWSSIVGGCCALAAMGIAFGVRSLWGRGVAFGLVAGLQVLPVLIWYLNAEVSRAPVDLFKNFSPSWCFETMAFPTGYCTLGGVGLMVAAVSRLRSWLRLRKYQRKYRVKAMVPALVLGACLAATGSLHAGVQAHFACAPYRRAQETLPLVLKFDPPPGKVSIHVEKGSTYTIKHPPASLELAVFVPEQSTHIEIEADGKQILLALPPQVVARDREQRLVAVYAPAPGLVRADMGLRPDESTSFVYAGLEDAPQQWALYSVWDAVVVDGAQGLGQGAERALAQYVSGGGKVVLIGASALTAHFPAPHTRVLGGADFRLFSFGAGLVLQVFPDAMARGDMGSIVRAGLEHLFCEGGPTRPFGPPLFMPGSSPFEKTDVTQFAGVAVERARGGVLWKLALLVGALVAIALVFTPFRSRFFFFCAAVTLTSGGLAALVFTRPAAPATLLFHAAILTGPQPDSPGVLSVWLMPDPRGEASVVPTPQEMQVVPLAPLPAAVMHEGEQILSLTAPGGTLRWDIPYVLADPVMVLARAEMRDGEFFIEGRSDGVSFNSLARSIEPLVGREASEFAAWWADTYAYGGRDWGLEWSRPMDEESAAGVLLRWWPIR